MEKLTIYISYFLLSILAHLFILFFIGFVYFWIKDKDREKYIRAELEPHCCLYENGNCELILMRIIFLDKILRKLKLLGICPFYFDRAFVDKLDFKYLVIRLYIYSLILILLSIAAKIIFKIDIPFISIG